MFRAVAAGIAAQWSHRGRSWPALLGALAPAPRCLTGLLEMRGSARTETALRLYLHFETRLARLIGQPTIDWPEGFGMFETRAARSARREPTLPHIDPSQALLLIAPGTTQDSDAARVYWAALDTSFGPDATWPVPDETMQRLLTPYLPESWRPRWTAGLGLEPPAVFRPPAEEASHAALAVMDSAGPLTSLELPGRTVAELAFTRTTVDLAVFLAAGEDHPIVHSAA